RALGGVDVGGRGQLRGLVQAGGRCGAAATAAAPEDDGDQDQADRPADRLGGDETRYRAGGDTREGVGEGPADRHRGVGEGGGGGEPVRRPDVAGDRGGGEAGTSGVGETEDQHDQT